MTKKLTLSVLLLMMLAALAACGKPSDDHEEFTKENDSNTATSPEYAQRTSMADFAAGTDYEIVTSPSVRPNPVNPDFSNVMNYDQYSWMFENYPDFGERLLKNGFVVTTGGFSEFFSIYESNRYAFIPNFVTTDSMLHTYHLYFSHLLKKLEKDYFYDALKKVSAAMVEESLKQYEELKGTSWENAALRNAAYFTVAAKIMQSDISVSPLVEEIVDKELSLIAGEAEIVESPVINWNNQSKNPLKEDYSQYKVRGYYTDNETLSQYFKAMMWFGRITFRISNDEENKSAILMVKAMENTEINSLWKGVYDVTSFFMGTSDDSGYYEYRSVIDEVCGNTDLKNIATNDTLYEKMVNGFVNLAPPSINSIPVEDNPNDDDKSDTYGFRFMGQRETFDANVFQKLVYDSVGPDSTGVNRMLPSGLDVVAALGSDEASAILEEQGAFDYKNYKENLEVIKKTVKSANDSVWTSSLYNSWINMIRPFTVEKGEGYPVFMQNKAWTRKQINTFLGSFAELKHDSVLYSKQMYAEMGGGDENEPDYRGYVEPEPLVYVRLAVLSQITRDGLMNYGMISSEDADMVSLLQELAEKLIVISNKELKSESLTEEEHDLIKSYGGQLEHLLYEALKDESEDGYFNPAEHPSAIITDVATDPNGQVLEIGTGFVDRIFVIVDVEGSLRIAEGGVYSYYEFEHPINERLTDKDWRIMLGIELPKDDNGNPIVDGSYRKNVEQPEWVKEFKIFLN